MPGYVRTELKKKTGISIDGNGNILKSEGNDSNDNEHKDNNSNLLLFKNSNKKEKSDADTKSINSYKPSGNLIYNNDILNSLNSNLDKK